MELDFLKDTWIFQQVFNEGKEEARQEALEWLLIRFVEIRFPTLLASAKQIIEQNVPLEQLETIPNRLYRANTIEEAQSALVSNG